MNIVTEEQESIHQLHTVEDQTCHARVRREQAENRPARTIANRDADEGETEDHAKKNRTDKE